MKVIGESEPGYRLWRDIDWRGCEEDRNIPPRLGTQCDMYPLLQDTGRALHCRIACSRSVKSEIVHGADGHEVHGDT